MQFIQDGELYKVVKITGPTHNLLGLAFGGQQNDEVVVDILSLEDEASRQQQTLDSAEIEAQVFEGVNTANAEFGTQYCVKRIQYVSTDSPPAETYKELAASLVQRLVQNEPFTQALPDSGS